jgi:zinc protease
VPTILSAPASLAHIERFTLPNGLRVVLARDETQPAVGVAVHYDVGFRSEPPGRTGFAHLFEHMMFQGSESVPRNQHAALVQGAGGTFNGSTHPDYTEYFEVLPAPALELALFLEADRMRSLELTAESLENQVSVVKQEINVNVVNQPYGGFPWIMLPAVLFTTFPNAHNGYGDFRDLDAATLDDVRDFFSRYYAPGNAVLTVAGRFDPEEARLLVERHFADVSRKRVPARPSFGEPPPTEERRSVQEDRLAPQPAVALGWRVPDPVGQFREYLAFVVLAAALSDGEASRLHRRMVLEDRLVTSVAAYLGTFGDPFDGRDPMVFHVQALYPMQVPTERVVGVIDEEIRRVAEDGPRPGELDRVQAYSVARFFGSLDHLHVRVRSLGATELIHGRAEALAELPGAMASITGDEVQGAARRLAEEPRALVEVRPATEGES